MTGRRSIPAMALALFPCGWLLLQSLAQRLDHDESQYVAGAALALDGLPFRDFMLLQPPLHAWLFAPIALVWRSDVFTAMRVATAISALLMLVAVYRAQRAMAVPVGRAVAATLLMSCCGSFQFCAGVVRNDMPAAMFATFGIWALVRLEASPSRRGAALGGLALGFATATKLSFAPMAATALLHLLLGAERRKYWPAFVAGGVAGSAPALFALAFAPEAFVWGVFTFALVGPSIWYRRIGAAHELTLTEKALDLVGYMLIGPAAAAIVLVAAWLIGTRLRGPTTRLLALLLMGGLVGAALPTPTHKQYLLPVLPPLFVVLGAALTGATGRLRFLILWLFATVGLAPTAAGFARITATGLPTRAVDATGKEIAAIMHGCGDAGPIATFSPERVSGSGLAPDRRFATGPFVFRSGSALAPGLAARLALPTPGSVDGMFRHRPPMMVLVGYERPHRSEGRALDRELAAAARRLGWRPLALRDGQGRLYLSPSCARRTGRT